MGNEAGRDLWVRRILAGLPAGSTLLDVGAGEQPYRTSATHLAYLAQDAARYEGRGSGEGLQTGAWNMSGIDLVCDLLDIPEDRLYDAILCTEVLEHVPDPVAALAKMARLLRPGGKLIVTAPFVSLTHFAPYHYATGFNRYFYEMHLSYLGFTIDVMENNGGFFDLVAQEISRSRSVYRTYLKSRPPLLERWLIKLAAEVMRRWARREGVIAVERNSSELASFGWHVMATKARDAAMVTV